MDLNKDISNVDDLLNTILMLNPEMKNVEELPDNIQKKINDILRKYEIEEIANKIISEIDKNKLSLLLYVFRQFYNSDVLPPENERVHNPWKCYWYNKHIIEKAKLACKILMNRDDFDSLSRKYLLDCVENYLLSAKQNDSWNYHEVHDRYHVGYKHVASGDSSQVYQNEFGHNYTEEFTELDLSIIENPNIPFEYKEQIYELAKQAKNNDKHAWKEILDMFVTYPVVYFFDEYVTLQSLKSQLTELRIKVRDSAQGIVNLSESQSKFKWFVKIRTYFYWCRVCYYEKRARVIEKKIYDIESSHHFRTILDIPYDQRFPAKRYDLANLRKLENDAQEFSQEIADLKIKLANITNEYEKRKPKFNWKWLTLIGTLIYCVKWIYLFICHNKAKKILLSRILTLESQPVVQTLKNAEERQKQCKAYNEHEKYVLRMQKIIDAYEKQKNLVNDNREVEKNRDIENKPKQNVIFDNHELT